MGILCLMLFGCKKRWKIIPAKKTQIFFKEKSLQMKDKIKLEDLSQALLLTDLTPD